MLNAWKIAMVRFLSRDKARREEAMALETAHNNQERVTGVISARSAAASPLIWMGQQLSYQPGGYSPRSGFRPINEHRNHFRF